jgi:CubicO group peptidase (beta-lactamase class C family)
MMSLTLLCYIIFSIHPFVSSQSIENCPLLGPVFPSAKDLAHSEAIYAASKTFPAVLLGALKNGLLDNQTTSFSINVFSSATNQTLFDYHYAAPGLDGSLTKGYLNSNTIYRVGSLSKLFTVYTLLVTAGFDDFDSPITKFVPSLVQNADSSSEQDTLDKIRWSEVTIRTLASHLAGIPREYNVLDLLTEGLPIEKLGLPTLNGSETLTCGLGLQPGLKPCSREVWLKGLAVQNPFISTFNTPVYSNAGYSLLGIALENIANESYANVLDAALVRPLGLSSTSVLAPLNTSNSIIIPGDPYWPLAIGDETP